MALFGWAFRRRRVLSVTQPAWDEFSLSSCDVNQFSAFCYTTRSGSFIIHHHSSFSIHHCSFGIHHLSFIIQKSMNNRWKIYQKSVKNRQKINPKSTKIGLGAPWSRLGGVQAVMEASKTPLREVLGADRVNSWFFEDVSNEITTLGQKWWFRSRVRACQKVTKLIDFRKYHKS